MKVSKYSKEDTNSLPSIWFLGSYVLPGYAPPPDSGAQVQAGPPLLPPLPHLGPQGF